MFYRLKDLNGWPIVALNDGTIIKASLVCLGPIGWDGGDPVPRNFLTLESPYQVLPVPKGSQEINLIGPKIYVPLVSVAYWTD